MLSGEQIVKLGYWPTDRASPSLPFLPATKSSNERSPFAGETAMLFEPRLRIVVEDEAARPQSL
jgi:hypothetical protein